MPNRPRLHRSFSHGPILLARWQLVLLYICVAGLFTTGVAWLAWHFLGSDTGDGLPPFRLEKLWAMRLHAACALVALVAFGSLLTVHVRSAWHRHRNRRSGSLNLAAWGMLTLSAYALWYAPEGIWREWFAWLHWGVGALLPAVLVLHIYFGRKAGARSVKNHFFRD